MASARVANKTRRSTTRTSDLLPERQEKLKWRFAVSVAVSPTVLALEGIVAVAVVIAAALVRVV